MKHLTSFETTAAYNEATLDLPNVSLIEENMSVYYNPYVPETKLVVYYDIQDVSSPTTVCTNYGGNFKSMEIDGKDSVDITVQGNITYQFDSVGEHVIKYELNGGLDVGTNAPLFYNLSTVKRVIIPNTFLTIGNSAFNSCNSLTSIDIPNNVTYIGQAAFFGCSSLTSIVIPNSVTSIGMSAFNGCNSLISCTIGSGVTSIDNGAFYGCSSLTSIVIPDGVTSIGDGAFRNCSSLTNIICNATTAPTIQSKTFQDVNTNGTLTVPVDSTGYDVWMSTGDYYLGKYNWTKVEQ